MVIFFGKPDRCDYLELFHIFGPSVWRNSVKVILNSTFDPKDVFQGPSIPQERRMEDGERNILALLSTLYVSR